MVRKNGELGHDGHANNERRDTSDDLKDGEKFQRGGEKFQRNWEASLIGLLCSLRPHDRNVLPQCAQWEPDSGHREAHSALEWRGVMSKLGRAL